MNKHTDNNTGKVIVEVDDLSFLFDNEHYTWLQRHIYNRIHKRALRKADDIIAADEKVASDIVKYYFIPKSKIRIIRRQQ